MTNMKLLPYLIFNGNCREAMTFYAEVLNGEITKMQTIEEAPIPFPPDGSDLIFDSELVSQEVTIKASDSRPDQPIEIGKNVSLFLVFSDVASQQQVYNKLSAEGKIMMPLPEEGGFAMFSDKFGISWMLAFHG